MVLHMIVNIEQELDEIFSVTLEEVITMIDEC